MPTPPLNPFPISRMSGDVANNGESIILRIEANGAVSDFSASKADVAGLVHMLLALGDLDPEGKPETTTRADQWPPLLTVNSVSVGKSPDGQSVLAIETAAATLMFCLPETAIKSLDRTLVLLDTENKLKI